MAVTAHRDLSVEIAFYKSTISTSVIVARVGLRANDLDRYFIYLFFAHGGYSSAHIKRYEMLMACMLGRTLHHFRKSLLYHTLSNLLSDVIVLLAQRATSYPLPIR